MHLDLVSNSFINWAKYWAGHKRLFMSRVFIWQPPHHLHSHRLLWWQIGNNVVQPSAGLEVPKPKTLQQDAPFLPHVPSTKQRRSAWPSVAKNMSYPVMAVLNKKQDNIVRRWGERWTTFIHTEIYCYIPLKGFLSYTLPLQGYIAASTNTTINNNYAFHPIYFG